MKKRTDDAEEQHFSKPTFWLNPKEYSKIVSEIDSVFDARYCGKNICAHSSFGIDGVAYIYWFENHGFNNYNIFLRVINDR